MPGGPVTVRTGGKGRNNASGIEIMMSNDDTPRTGEGEARDPPERDQHLHQAVEAAAAGNMKRVLHAIQQSAVFDGFLLLVARLPLATHCCRGSASQTARAVWH